MTKHVSTPPLVNIAMRLNTESDKKAFAKDPKKFLNTQGVEVHNKVLQDALKQAAKNLKQEMKAQKSDANQAKHQPRLNLQG